MGDGEKMATFFEDKKKERERQQKGRRKLLDGSSSEGSGDDKGGRDETQTGTYNSLTPLGATTRTSPPQIKGHIEPEQIARELNEIKLNHPNTSHENSNTSTESTNSKRIDTGELQKTSRRSPVFCGLTGIPLVELDYFSSEELDSLGNLTHMQEGSLESCFNVGNNDNQTNEEAQPEERGELEVILKEEPVAKDVEIKAEPGTQALVITADIYRKFLEQHTGFGKTPINAKNEREFHRTLKVQFSKTLAPYKTPLNTYPFDEEIANSVFIALHTDQRNRTHLFRHNEYQLQHIKHLLQNLAWHEDLRKNVESEILDRLTVIDRPLKDLAGIVERATGDLRTKLDDYNKERERDHRQGTEQVGFLSSLWQESEMDSRDSLKA